MQTQYCRHRPTARARLSWGCVGRLIPPAGSITQQDRHTCLCWVVFERSRETVSLNFQPHTTPHTLESVLVCLWAVCLAQQLLVGLEIILTQRVQTPVGGGSAGMRHASAAMSVVLHPTVIGAVCRELAAADWTHKLAVALRRRMQTADFLCVRRLCWQHSTPGDEGSTCHPSAKHTHLSWSSMRLRIMSRARRSWRRARYMLRTLCISLNMLTLSCARTTAGHENQPPPARQLFPAQPLPRHGLPSAAGVRPPECCWLCRISTNHRQLAHTCGVIPAASSAQARTGTIAHALSPSTASWPAAAPR